MLSEKEMETVKKRKNDLHDLCMELKWTYRGYQTHIFDATKNDNPSVADTEAFVHELLSYVSELEPVNLDLLEAYLISSLLFVRLQCRSSEYTFYSIYKIAKAIDENIENGLKEFKTSTYGYMLDAFTIAEDSDERSRMYAAFSDFERLFDDENVPKQYFLGHVITSFDRYLYDHKFSFLLDDYYEPASRELRHFIRSSKYRLRKLTSQESSSDDN